MITEIFNYQGKSYTVKLKKAAQSFSKQNVIDAQLLEAWRAALGCDQVVMNGDQFLFLVQIPDAEIEE